MILIAGNNLIRNLPIMTERISEKIKSDWIAVDWGTSRLRAYAMRHRAAGEGGLRAQQLCLGEIISEFGAGKIQPDQYDETLYALIAPWLADRNTSAPLNILICGMAGARGGWCEAGYLGLHKSFKLNLRKKRPYPAQNLSTNSLHKNSIGAWIVPGSETNQPARCDARRGNANYRLDGTAGGGVHQQPNS